MRFLDRRKPLSDLPHFADLTESEMRAVCAAGQEVTVPQSWSMIWESTTPDKAYLVLDGRLQVSHHGTPIAEVGAGDLVGEIGVSEHRLRTGTVTALTPLTMLNFTPEAFLGLCADLPAFGAAVHSTVERRKRELGLSNGSTTED